jgi:hypothetical protein
MRQILRHGTRDTSNLPSTTWRVHKCLNAGPTCSTGDASIATVYIISRVGSPYTRLRRGRGGWQSPGIRSSLGGIASVFHDYITSRIVWGKQVLSNLFVGFGSDVLPIVIFRWCIRLGIPGWIWRRQSNQVTIVDSIWLGRTQAWTWRMTRWAIASPWTGGRRSPTARERVRVAKVPRGCRGGGATITWFIVYKVKCEFVGSDLSFHWDNNVILAREVIGHNVGWRWGGTAAW